jgi:hypothetical protein
VKVVQSHNGWAIVSRGRDGWYVVEDNFATREAAELAVIREHERRMAEVFDRCASELWRGRGATE